MALLTAFVVLVCLFAVAPVVVVVLSSFTAADYISFPPVGLSIKWYAAIGNRPEFIDSFFFSFGLAAATAVAATALGLATALVLVRYRFPGREALQTFFLSPLFVPGFVLGAAVLQFYGVLGLRRDLLAFVLAHVLITAPYAVRLVSVSLIGFDRNLERAAAILGAGPWYTHRRVTLPLIQPGVLGSVVFVFIISFDNVAMSLFLATPSLVTLPVRIYVYMDSNYNPLVNSVSALLVAVAVVMIVVIERTVGTRTVFGAPVEAGERH